MHPFFALFQLPQWRYLKNLTQLYLPLLILTALTGVTYLLVQQSTSDSPLPEPLKTDEPDFFATNLRLLSYNSEEGNKAFFIASYAQHLPHNKTYSLEQMRATFWQKADQVVYANANQALVNDNGNEVQLMGDAQIEQQKPATPPAHLKGEFLHLFLNEERIQSHLPVVFTQGKDSVSADRLHYSQASDFLQLNGRVRATLYPEPKPVTRK